VILDGKRILVTGVVNRRSIAFAVAEQAQHAGAEVLLTSFGRVRSMTERAAKRLPKTADVLELDVNRTEDFARLREELEERWGGIDGAVHAIAFAPPDALGGEFLNTPRESATVAFQTSAFSLKALAEALLPLYTNANGSEPGGGSLVGLDFDASVAWPAYDWMGVSKAALEAASRYLARDLGPHGVRVNLVYAGRRGNTRLQPARGPVGRPGPARLGRARPHAGRPGDRLSAVRHVARDQRRDRARRWWLSRHGRADGAARGRARRLVLQQLTTTDPPSVPLRWRRLPAASAWSRRRSSPPAAALRR
jgi:meromycolic acid enoyl-[acyl-carrier-protein] reductase